MKAAFVRAASWLAVLVVLVVARPAFADPKDEARKLLEQGDVFLQRGDYRDRKGRDEQARQEYEKALEAYEKAYDLVPNPAIFFAIAKAELKLERYVDAARHYYRLIDETPEMSAELRMAADEVLAEAKLHLATVRMQIEPAGSRVSVDGEEVGVAPLAHPLHLPPGQRTLSVTAQGHVPFEESIALEAGGDLTREVTLERVPVVMDAPPPSEEPAVDVRDDEPGAAPGKRRLIVGISLTATFATAATVTGLLALSRHGTFQDESLPMEERLDAAESGQTYAGLTDLLAVATLAAGAFTAYHYFVEYAPAQRSGGTAPPHGSDDADPEGAPDDVDPGDNPLSARPPRLWLAPYVAEGGGGVAVGLRF